MFVCTDGFFGGIMVHIMFLNIQSVIHRSLQFYNTGFSNFVIGHVTLFW